MADYLIHFLAITATMSAMKTAPVRASIALRALSQPVGYITLKLILFFEFFYKKFFSEYC